MNLQGRTLQQGFTDDDVRLLPTEPTLLNLPIPDNERLGAFLGPTTLAAIQNFRKLQTLSTGIVGNASPFPIDTAVNAQFPPTSILSGRVHTTLSSGIGGLRTQMVDKNVGRDGVASEGVETGS